MSTTDSATFVSEFTKKTLQQFDWEVGDPIPASLGELLEAVRSRTPPSKAPGLIVDAAVMSEDDINAVKTALAGAKVSAVRAQRKNHVDAATLGLPENVRQLYSAIQNKDENAGPEIIDDRNTPPAPATAPETVPAPEAAAAPEEPLVPPVADLPAVFCPRCSWDMRRQFDVEITDTDKEAFVAITLGGERFKKSYELLGGKYVVKFRSLLAEENTIIHHQLLIDQKDGQFLSDTEWFMRMFEYRLALSVESVVVSDKLRAQVPELSAVANIELPNSTDDKTKTAMVRMREYVVADVFSSEVTRRLVGAQFREFQRLCEALEAMALEPSFW
jgi:hypothetical protein